MEITQTQNYATILDAIETVEGEIQFSTQEQIKWKLENGIKIEINFVLIFSVFIVNEYDYDYEFLDVIKIQIKTNCQNDVKLHKYFTNQNLFSDEDKNEDLSVIREKVWNDINSNWGKKKRLEVHYYQEFTN